MDDTARPGLCGEVLQPSLIIGKHGHQRGQIKAILLDYVMRGFGYGLSVGKRNAKEAGNGPDQKVSSHEYDFAGCAARRAMHAGHQHGSRA
jgi:hypothetical protein